MSMPESVIRMDAPNRIARRIRGVTDKPVRLTRDTWERPASKLCQTPLIRQTPARDANQRVVKSQITRRTGTHGCGCQKLELPPGNRKQLTLNVSGPDAGTAGTYSNLAVQ